MITGDGCAVEVYARLPTAGDPELIHTHTPPGCSILDLGAGTGRIADPLARLGHRVVAVDNSPDMLARIRRAKVVLANIEDLQLAERFDVVLLASHLINTPDPAQRGALLATVTRHLSPTGRALIEWHPPAWFDQLEPGCTYAGTIGDLASDLRGTSLGDGLLTAVRHLPVRRPELDPHVRRPPPRPCRPARSDAWGRSDPVRTACRCSSVAARHPCSAAVARRGLTAHWPPTG